jgi:hypothetical protein
VCLRPGVEQRPEPVPELVGKVGLVPLYEPPALGQQGRGRHPQPVGREPARRWFARQQGPGELGLCGGKPLSQLVRGHELDSTAWMAASSAARSASVG